MHSKREHAYLSASGANRWLNCPGSAKLEDKYPDEDSVYSLEGTQAHELAEKILRGVKYSGYDKDMFEYVKIYTDYVQEIANQNPKCFLQVEQKISFDEYVPEGFGSNDAVVITKKTLYVFDLKYGKGVKVDAINNPQMRLYALGFLQTYGFVLDFDTVVMCVVQPRLDHVSTETMSVDALKKWGQSIKPVAFEAFNGSDKFKVGDWCKFCKAKAECRAFADHNLMLAKHDFKKPETLNKNELSEIYIKSDMFQEWINSVKKHMLEKAVQGENYKGLKLVEGRSRRVITDENKAYETLLNAGYADVTVTKLKTLTELEKIVGKKAFADLRLTDKPPGKPTLVTVDDPRPVYNSLDQAKKDFQ